MLAKAFEVW